MLQLSSDPKRATALLLAGFVAVVVLLYLWWPAGTLVGLIGGGLAVHRIGTGMQRRAEAEQWSDLHDLTSWLADEPAAQPARRRCRAPVWIDVPAAEEHIEPEERSRSLPRPRRSVTPSVSSSPG